MDFISTTYPLLAAADNSAIKIITQFIIFPFVLQRVAKIVLAAVHSSLSSEDLLTLSQRATRAVVATSLLLGALQTMPQSDWATNLFIGSSFSCEYYVLGTICYYFFDCLLLIKQGNWNGPMWVHHVGAMALFCVVSYMRLGYGAAMYVLMSEGLVPWGFLLFYFKLTKQTSNPIYKLVTIGGFLFILFRASIWLYIGSRTLVDGASSVPMWFQGMVYSYMGIGLFLEYTWGNLYLRNIGVAFNGEKRKSGKSKKKAKSRKE